VLTQGYKQRRGRLTWGFGLPSGRPGRCVDLFAEGLRPGYARPVESPRPDVRARDEQGLRLTRRPGFARRVRCFLGTRDVAVVRVHCGGDFDDAAYAGK
jgi:hypothetical protein